MKLVDSAGFLRKICIIIYISESFVLLKIAKYNAQVLETKSNYDI